MRRYGAAADETCACGHDRIVHHQANRTDGKGRGTRCQHIGGCNCDAYEPKALAKVDARRGAVKP